MSFLGDLFNEAADKTTDRHDHAELHAAADVFNIILKERIDLVGQPYISQWINGLVMLHNLGDQILEWAEEHDRRAAATGEQQEGSPDHGTLA